MSKGFLGMRPTKHSDKTMACLGPMVVYYENATFVPFVIVCVFESSLQTCFTTYVGVHAFTVSAMFGITQSKVISDNFLIQIL